MKSFLTVMCFFAFLTLTAQTQDEAMVKQAVVDFFDAFHKQDTTRLKAKAKGNIKLQSITVNKEGKTILSESNYNDFVTSIASIPKENKFEEKLLDFNIKVDGNMANAWTPYEFWYQGNFSHCGVNSFQLIKEENEWKIIYLVDTRRSKGCKS